MPSSKIKRKEKDMYAPALRFLNTQPGTKAWLHHNNGVFLPGAGRFVRKANQEDGVPDIVGVKLKAYSCLKYGQAFAFEVKREGQIKNVSPAQRRWMEDFHRFGGVAFVVDTMDDLIKSWEEI